MLTRVRPHRLLRSRRDQGFESAFLQQGVWREPDFQHDRSAIAEVAERIDGRPGHILARAASKADVAVEQKEVAIGGCDLDLAGLDLRTILRGDNRKRATALQPAG